jgi:hypothetical protein
MICIANTQRLRWASVAANECPLRGTDSGPFHFNALMNASMLLGWHNTCQTCKKISSALSTARTTSSTTKETC